MMASRWTVSLVCFAVIVQHATAEVTENPQDVGETTMPADNGGQTTAENMTTAGGGDGQTTSGADTMITTTSEINECSPNPCEHGQCSIVDTGYQCICSKGWGGVNCTDLVECYWNPCAHYCPDSGHECSCSPGWTVNNCPDIGECWPRSCENGDCTSVDRRTVCTCWPDWTGTYCEVAMNASTTSTDGNVSQVTTDATNTTSSDNATGNCSSNSCEHGECTNVGSGDQCSCLPGWSGTSCEIADECYWNPCTHDCPNSAGLCSCWPGWTDSNCEGIPIGECWPRSCVNGDCMAVGVVTVCTCWPGWTGTYCEENIDDCWSDPCVNGCCTDRQDGYVCGCWPGWTGKNCDIRQDINECESNPCINDLQCEDLNKGYRCVY